jgi:hypothetical protein
MSRSVNVVLVASHDADTAGLWEQIADGVPPGISIVRTDADIPEVDEFETLHPEFLEWTTRTQDAIMTLLLDVDDEGHISTNVAEWYAKKWLSLMPRTILLARGPAAPTPEATNTLSGEIARLSSPWKRPLYVRYLARGTHNRLWDVFQRALDRQG